MSQQASNTLHKMNRMKILIENPAMARLRDIFEGWGPADPRNKLMGAPMATIDSHTHNTRFFNGNCREIRLPYLLKFSDLNSWM